MLVWAHTKKWNVTRQHKPFRSCSHFRIMLHQLAWLSSASSSRDSCNSMLFLNQTTCSRNMQGQDGLSGASASHQIQTRSKLITECMNVPRCHLIETRNRGFLFSQDRTRSQKHGAAVNNRLLRTDGFQIVMCITGYTLWVCMKLKKDSYPAILSDWWVLLWTLQVKY